MNKKIFELKYNLSPWDKYTLHTKLWCSIWHARHVSISVTKTVQNLSPATFWNVQICHLQIKFIVNKYHGISIHCIQNRPGTKKNIFIHLRWWLWQAKHISISLRTRKQSRNYHQPNFNLLYLRKLPWAHSIFLHITSGHNDHATEKNYRNLGLLFSGI